MVLQKRESQRCGNSACQHVIDTIILRYLKSVTITLKIHMSEPMTNEDWFRKFISFRRWIYAKTMPKFPHEYTIREWQSDHEREFEQAVIIIRELGKEEYFFQQKNDLLLYRWLEILDHGKSGK